MKLEQLVADLFTPYASVPGTEVRERELRAVVQQRDALIASGPITQDSKKLHKLRKLNAQIRLFTIMQIMAINATNATNN